MYYQKYARVSRNTPIGDQNTEEISKLVKSLGINLDESMIRAALSIIKRVLESKAFNITEIISGKAVAINR